MKLSNLIKLGSHRHSEPSLKMSPVIQYISPVMSRVSCGTVVCMCQLSYDIKYLSFIDPERGVFGEIFPEVMIFPEDFSPGHTRVAMVYYHGILPWYGIY